VSSFFEDLEAGLSIEEKLIRHIRNKYPSASLIHAYKGYDIWIPEISKSIEVKYDPMSNETGNFVVEIEMFGKRSALMATKADYWAFYDEHKCYLISPMDIVYCIFINRLQYREFVGKGDDASKKAFLVPKEFIEKLSKIFYLKD